jgi:RNA polymerase sigma factor (sigma-70 family)
VSSVKGAKLNPVDNFEEIYQKSFSKFCKRLYSRCYDFELAEDVVQTAFMKAYAARHEWKPTAPIEAWIWRIVLNTFISVKRSGEVTRKSDTEAEVILEFREDPTDDLENFRANERFEWLVSKLSPRVSEACRLVWGAGMTNRQAAKILNIPERTVGSRLRVARITLRPYLAAE